MAKSAMKDLTVGSPMKLVFGFAVPLLFGFLFQQMYNFVDTAIVGRFLGSAALAAVGATGSLNFLILGFCMGICSGFSIPIAQSFGAKDETELRRYVTNSVWLSAVISVILAVVTALGTRTMLQWMNTPAEIIDDAVSYIQLIFAAIPVTVLYNLSGGILRALGDSKTPVYYLVLASLINIVLDLACILYLHMGVAGAAFATVVSQLVAGLGCVISMKRRFPILKFSREDWRFRPLFARRLVNIGVPMGLQYSITAIGSVVLQIAVNGLGTVAVAAVTAASKLSTVFTCVFDALATTMATFAGQNMGAKKLDRIHQGLRAASVIGIVYCVLAFVIIWLGGRQLITLFVDAGDVEVVDKAYQFLMVNVAFYIPLLYVNIVRLSVQGMGFTRVAVLAGCSEMVARILVAMAFVPMVGFAAAAYASPVAWIFADAFLFPCYFSIMRKLRLRMYPAAENTASAAQA